MIYTKPIMEKKELENIAFNGTQGYIMSCYCKEPFNCNSYACAHFVCPSGYKV